MVETESYVRKFTNIICEMKSMHAYSVLNAVNTPTMTDIFGGTWLAITSTARNAVVAIKLAVTKNRRIFDAPFLLS